MMINSDNIITKLKHGLLPPLLAQVLGGFRGSRFSGNYPTWREALSKSGGYDQPSILEKVKESLLQVKNGNGIYERDSVLFDKTEYSWPVLATILWISSQYNNHLNIIDFGGSLGSSYFQNRRFLQHLEELTWIVIEQPSFVACGKEFFEDDHLKFFPTIDSYLEKYTSNVILLSGVLQYLEEPYGFLERLIDNKFQYILFDRTPFITGPKDRITIQKVSPTIYSASYPAWFFSEYKFLNFMTSHYDLITDFEANDSVNILSEFKGYIFKWRGY